MLLSSTVLAQGAPVHFGVLKVASGLEGGDPGYGRVAWQAARTRILAGAEWSASEAKSTAYGLYGMFEIERRGSFGLEFQYRRSLPWGLTGFIGPLFIWRPKSLLGIHAGFGYEHSLSDAMALALDLGVAAFPIGSDLPHKDSVLLWATSGLALKVGF